MQCWIVPEGAASSADRVSARGGQRGSLLVASVLMMFFLLIIAGLAVDMSRYYLSKENVQNVADGAALAGARALGQFHYHDDINQKKVHEAVVEYIRANQGEEYADLYKGKQDGKVNGIHVAKFSPSDTDSQTCVDFSINDGSLELNQPANVDSEILGAALSDGDGDRFPVTARLEVTRKDGSDTHMEPWGDFGDPLDGNVNHGGDLDSVNLEDLPPEWQVDVRARSWDNPGLPLDPSETYNENMTVRTGDDEAFMFRDGDQAPGFEGWQDQPGADEMIEPYLNEDNEVTLQENQVIVFFELYTRDKTQSYYDKQDLAVLLTMSPTGESGGGGVRSGSPPWITADGAPCGNSEPVYRVGVQSYENFEPLFLPESVFGHKNKGITQKSVAEIRPQFVRQHGNFPLECNVYSGGTLNVSTELKTEGSLCLSGSLSIGSQSNNGDSTILRRFAWPEGASVDPPDGWRMEAQHTFSGTRSVPSASSDLDNPSNYTVNMGTFSTWSDGSCDDGNWWTNDYGKEMPGVEWKSGDAVCVKQSGGQFEINSDGNSGTIVDANNPDSPVTIYSSNSVEVLGSGIDFQGAIISQQTITIDGDAHSFEGHPDALGGVTLWAGVGGNTSGNLNLTSSTSTFEGIVGAAGNVTFGSSSNPPSIMKGKLIAGGNLTLQSSGVMNLLQDRSAYNVAILNNAGEETDWTFRAAKPMGDRIPPFSGARVKLIN